MIGFDALSSFILVFLVWSLLSLAILRRRKEAIFQGFEERGNSASFRTIGELFFSAIGFVTLFVISPLLFQKCSLFFPLAFSSEQRVLLYHCGSIIITSILFIIFSTVISQESWARVYGASGSFFQLRLFIKGFFFAVLLYPFLMMLNGIVSVLVSSITELPVNPQTAALIIVSSFSVPWLFYVSLVVVIFFVPFVEELLFRGAFDSFLSTIVHPLLAIVISSILFSSVHYSVEQGASNYGIMTTLFVFGCVSSLLKRREKNIVASIGFHSGFNAISLITLYIQKINL